MIDDLAPERLAVRQLFGNDATITGRLGSDRIPGELRIVVSGLPMGVGRTFAAALGDAQRRASRLSKAGVRARCSSPPVAAGVEWTGREGADNTQAALTNSQTFMGGSRNG